MAVTNGRRPGDWPGDSGNREVNSWRVREIRRLWREACEGYNLCQWVPTPSGWTVAGPEIKRVMLGDPTVLLVQLRPTQDIAELVQTAPSIAAHLGTAALKVLPLRGQWVRVQLLAVEAPSTPVPIPLPAPSALPPASPLPAASPPPLPVRRTRRRGPSAAWTGRWHARRWRRPEQPS
jgi:hypothetical protein